MIIRNDEDLGHEPSLKNDITPCGMHASALPILGSSGSELYRPLRSIVEHKLERYFAPRREMNTENVFAWKVLIILITGTIIFGVPPGCTSYQ